MCQRALQSVVLGGLSGATAQLPRARTGPELGPLEEKTTRFVSALELHTSGKRAQRF